jgi:hypothetical protein
MVYVTSGATLTIEAGTVVACFVAADPVNMGSLCVCRDGKIRVLGTATDAVIMTSTEDVATWTGSVVVRDGGTGKVTSITTMGNPKTGTWRASCSEWGNLTILGQGLIGAEKAADNSFTRNYRDGAAPVPFVTNTARPTGLNLAVMEGLTPSFDGDPRVLYGGANDDHSSGELHYLSIRYGGLVKAAAVELNGLSMGGVGRGTPVDHIEIMNNVDDGIETWGGTVNYKYIAIWNIGDDSFDVDEGWRGKAQFGLSVQGYSKTTVAQGSGGGATGLEIDGAEASDSVPMTCATIYNWTLIGQPDGQLPGKVGSDTGAEFRDEARVQMRQFIMMDVGENLVRELNSESTTDVPGWRYGDTGGGGNPSNIPFWAGPTGVWAMPYTETWNTANPQTGGHANMKDAAGTQLTQAQIQALFQCQSQGNNLGAHNQGYLMELTDSVFYNNNYASGAYTNTNALGPDVAGGKSVTVAGQAVDVANLLGNVKASAKPIVKYTREAPVTLTGSLAMANITDLDPRAAGSAVTSVDTAPNDGFFTPVRFRGAFSDKVNWLLGWTASDAYGFHAGQTNPANPTATLAVQMTTTSFQTVSGTTYTVESSIDGRNWVPFASVVGDGSVKTVASLVGFDNTKLYRVITQ